MARLHQPKKLRYRHKPSLNIREKKKPEGQDRFNIEVRLCPVANLPRLNAYGTYIGRQREQELYDEMMATLATIRSMIGGQYKIIQHKNHREITTKVLLAREADLLMIVLAHPSMVCKTYRLI